MNPCMQHKSHLYTCENRKQGARNTKTCGWRRIIKHMHALVNSINTINKIIKASQDTDPVFIYIS
jgi:hypothetical protein